MVIAGILDVICITFVSRQIFILFILLDLLMVIMPFYS